MQGTLHKVVRENLQTLCSAAEQGLVGVPLPDFVRAEPEDFLGCGLLQRGCALVGEMKVIALVRYPRNIARCLPHLGLPTDEASR
jgi:hypothetical protein